MAVDGTYNIEISSPMGKRTAKATLKAEGNSLSGSMASDQGTQAFTGGTVNGDAVAWAMEVSGPMGKMKLEYNGKVTGNEISGTVKLGNFGSAPFKGTRV
jgi:hypothetical protein